MNPRKCKSMVYNRCMYIIHDMKQNNINKISRCSKFQFEND